MIALGKPNFGSARMRSGFGFVNGMAELEEDRVRAVSGPARCEQVASINAVRYGQRAPPQRQHQAGVIRACNALGA
jgi:hypothetical protein